MEEMNQAATNIHNSKRLLINDIERLNNIYGDVLNIVVDIPPNDTHLVGIRNELIQILNTIEGDIVSVGKALTSAHTIIVDVLNDNNG